MEAQLPIVERADGITLLSTWIIAIREEADFAEEALSGQSSQHERAFRLVLTLNHEAIHFIQGLSTALPYSYSVNLLHTCGQMMADSRAGLLNTQRLAGYRQAYARLNKLLALPHRGVTPPALALELHVLCVRGARETLARWRTETPGSVWPVGVARA